MSKYVPGAPAANIEDVIEWAYREFLAIGDFTDQPTIARFNMPVWHSEPPKPRTGDVAYADGTDWNPGAGGEGAYVYKSTGSWVKLG